MLLTEYNEKKHMRDTYKEGYEEGEQAGYSKGEQAGYSKGEQAGYSKGEQAGYRKGEQVGRYGLLQEQVRKKLARGKSIEIIAEELEEDIEMIKEIVEKNNKQC